MKLMAEIKLLPTPPHANALLRMLEEEELTGDGHHRS